MMLRPLAAASASGVRFQVRRLYRETSRASLKIISRPSDRSRSPPARSRFSIIACTVALAGRALRASGLHPRTARAGRRSSGRASRDLPQVALQRCFSSGGVGRSATHGSWIESTGLGLTLGSRSAGGPGRHVVIVARTLYASTTDVDEFGTVTALGGGIIDHLRRHCRAGVSIAAVLGFGVALAITFGLAPFWPSSI